MSTSRAARKAETRERILAAALTLLTSGRSLDSLGLREVSREAGLAATVPERVQHFQGFAIDNIDLEAGKFAYNNAFTMPLTIGASPFLGTSLPISRTTNQFFFV